MRRPENLEGLRGFYNFVSNYAAPYLRTRLSQPSAMSNTNDIPPTPSAEDETDTVIDDATLLEYEIWWRDRYVMLEERGYRLRPRFRTDWVACWRTSGRSRAGKEDSLISRLCLSALIRFHYLHSTAKRWTPRGLKPERRYLSSGSRREVRRRQ